MLSWNLVPPGGKNECPGYTDQQADSCKKQDRVGQLPHKVSPSRAQSAAPTPTNMALPQHDAVEEHKTHHAAHVHQDDSDRERGKNGEGDQYAENRKIKRCDIGVRRSASVVWKSEVGAAE